MSWGGTETYKHPLNSMGWANEEQPQTSQVSRGVFELLPDMKSALFYAWNLAHLEIYYVDPALLPDAGQQFLNRAFRALHFHLYAAVPHILYPAGESQ